MPKSREEGIKEVTTSPAGMQILNVRGLMREAAKGFSANQNKTEFGRYRISSFLVFTD